MPKEQEVDEKLEHHLEVENELTSHPRPYYLKNRQHQLSLLKWSLVSGAAAADEQEFTGFLRMLSNDCSVNLT